MALTVANANGSSGGQTGSNSLRPDASGDFASARPAMPRTPLVDHGVFFVIRMALRAVRLGGVNGAAASSLRVLATTDQFNVVGPNTGRSSAQVVANQPFGDWPNKVFVGPFVGRPVSPIRLELAVAKREGSSKPQPAPFGLFHFAPKPFGYGHLNSNANWLSTGRETPAPARVYRLKSWLKVIGINARGVAAKVIENVSSFDRSNELRVCPAVSFPVGPTIHELPMAKVASRPNPLPALVCDDNFVPEALMGGWLSDRLSGPRSPLPHVVREAKRAPVRPSLAVLNNAFRLTQVTPLVASVTGYSQKVCY